MGPRTDSSRLIGYFEAICGVVLTAICVLLMAGALVPSGGQGDFALFGFVGGIMMLPIGLTLVVAGRTLWRDGWHRIRIQLLPGSAGILALVVFWWVDHGSRLGLAGTSVALAGLTVCGFLAIVALKT